MQALLQAPPPHCLSVPQAITVAPNEPSALHATTALPLQVLPAAGSHATHPVGATHAFAQFSRFANLSSTHVWYVAPIQRVSPAWHGSPTTPCASSPELLWVVLGEHAAARNAMTAARMRKVSHCDAAASW